MKKNLFLFFCFLFISCTSFTVLNKEFINITLQESGNIYEGIFQNKSEVNDILYKGDLKSAFDSSLLYLNIAYPDNVDVKKWVGKVNADRKETPIEVKFWHTLKNGSKKIIKLIKVSGLKNVSIGKIRLSDKYVYSNEFPYKIFDFKSNNNKYIVEITKIKIPFFQKEGVSNEIETFLLPEQVFLIRNSQNQVIAEFTDSNYSVYSKIDDEISDCKEMILLCMILREICTGI